MKLKNLNWGRIVFVPVFVFLIVVFILLSMKQNSIENNDCLKEIAENYCEEKGMFYDSHWWSLIGGRIIFYCVESERSIKYDKRYKFTEEEIKRCEDK